MHRATRDSAVAKVLASTSDPDAIADQLYLDTLSRYPNAAEQPAGRRFYPEERQSRERRRRPAVGADQQPRVSLRLTTWQARTDCPILQDRPAAFRSGEGFSRRRFLQIAGTGLVASYFADVVSPSLLFGATTSRGGLAARQRRRTASSSSSPARRATSTRGT